MKASYTMAPLPAFVARPLARVRDHLRPRWPVALLAAAAGCWRCAAPAPPERSVEGIAAMLASAAGGAVAPTEFVWEERGGFWRDAFFGRRVLFLGQSAGPRELYRARVRLTRRGRPIEVVDLQNLSDTPLGDDGDLIAYGQYAAFSTSAFGVVQGVTLLDLGGDAGGSLGARLARRVETGTWRGARRIEIGFGVPPAAVRFELTGSALVLALGAESAPAAMDLASGKLDTGTTDVYRARARTVGTREPNASETIATLARVLAGSNAAVLVSGALQRLQRAATRARQAFSGAPAARFEGPAAPTPGADEAWPPPSVAVTASSSSEHEGVWSAAPPMYLTPPHGAVGEAAPHLYRAVVRADATTVVHLVAMDTRQLELRFAAGWDSPRPLAGPRGDGRIPDAFRSRVVAAFNGAGPGTERGLGAMEDGRSIAPPQTHRPTVATLADGSPALGPWGPGNRPTSAIALRQAPALLGAPTAVSMASRDARWSFWAPPPADVAVERSALCLTRRRQLVYAWARRATEAALAAALRGAECDYALPLATAPARAGFAFLHLEEGAQTTEVVAPGMSLSAGDVASASPEEFFYVVAREATPAGSGFEPDDGTQPRPSWLPAAHGTTALHLGAEVRLHSFAAGRFEARLRTGTRELRHRNGGTFAAELTGDQQRRVLVAIGVGAARRRHARGLATEGSAGLPFRADSGAMVIDGDGSRVAIVRSEQVEVPKGGDATELPLTAEEGKLRPEGREVGSMRPRAAACTRDDGTLLVASTSFDSDEATTEALLALGCQRVVALDRGGHQPAFVHRAGTPTTPQSRYEGSALFLMDTDMAGRARRLDALEISSPVPSKE